MSNAQKRKAGTGQGKDGDAAEIQQPQPGGAAAGSTQKHPGSTQSRSSASHSQPGGTEGESGSSKSKPTSGLGEPGEPQPEPQLNLEVAQSCIDFVESYRRGNIQHGAVLLSLARTLGVQGNEQDPHVVSAAFESYSAQVREIENSRRDAEPDLQGQTSSEQESNGERERGRSGTLGKSKGKRRADRSLSHSSGRTRSRSPFSIGENEQPTGKRQKPDPSQYAWTTADAIAEKTLCEELRKTIAFLRIYGADIKSAKAHLLTSVGAPEFPDQEWTNVLQGKPVELDHVFSGQYSLEQDEKHVEKLGPVELSYRPLTPAKVVKTAGDWVIAWQRTAAATLYAFPHRKDELDGYYTHIFTLFGAIHDDHHKRILDYDRAVRKFVAAKRTMLLTDTHAFRNLHTQFIDSIGASAPSAAGTGDGKKRGAASSSRKPATDEACRRWNKGICNSSDGACKYAHRCSNCASTGHPVSGCPKDAKRK